NGLRRVMRQPRPVLVSRRTLMAGAAAASALLPAAAIGQPDGFRVIRARPGTARLRGADHDATPIWGFEGMVPGPVLRVKRGEEVRVRLINELPADTAIHWHGVRVPNAMDGVPGLTQKAVAAGESFDYRFVPPDAGTFWYRAPARSPQQRALYGLLIVDEAEPVDIDRDVALILDAWRLASDKGAHFTVNGLPSLDIPVIANERVRLRLVNAAPDRPLTVRLDRHAATIMAIDGQPAEPFVARDSRV